MAADPDRLPFSIVLTTLVLSVFAFSFHFTSFLHAKLALFCAGAVAMAVVSLFGGGMGWRGFRALAPLWALIALWLVRMITSPVRVPSDAIVFLAHAALLLIVAGFSAEHVQRGRRLDQVAQMVALSGVAVAFLGILQYFGYLQAVFPPFPEYGQRMYGVFGNQNLTGGFIAAALPVLFRWATGASAVWVRRAVFAALLIALSGLVLSESRSAWFAGGVGIAAAWAAQESKSPRTRWIIAGMAAFVIMLTAAFPQSTLLRFPQPVGIQSRLAMWQAAIGMARDHPLAGVGPGQYAYWSPLYIGRQGTQTPMPRDAIERHADQPHSEPLRLLAETGVPGILCGVWMAAAWFRRARDSSARIAAGPLAALLTFSLFNGILESVPHGLTALIFLAAPLVDTSPGARGSRLAAIPVAAAALFLTWAVVVPSAMIRKAQDVQLENSEASLQYHARAAAWPWPNAAAHRAYAIALAESGKDMDARREFLRALEGLDTGDLHLGLALVTHRIGDAHAARRHATDCLRRWPECADAARLAGAELTR